MAKSFHITTYGCQMNEHDSEIMAGILEQNGYRQKESIEEADIEIINTCSVRENADNRFFGNLGLLKKRRMEDKNFTVCVCGCMMQQKHIVDEIKSKYPWVDLVFGTHNLENVAELLGRVIENKTRLIELQDEGRLSEKKLPAKRLYPHKSLVNIMYGCNNFCSYCIVPYTRGREISRAPEDIVSEIRHLAGDGVKEVMLLGQNVNSYVGSKKGTGEKVDFAGLIHMIDDVRGIERVRFMTSHPKDLSDDLIDCFISTDKLCHNIHLPVQSGSNSVLKEMNRRYTREKYMELIKKLRERVPDISISTDIIIGFPGESDADFEDTMSLVEACEFDSAFTFLYSIRKGTPAARREDQIPEEVKHMRFDRLVDLVNSISLKKNRNLIGRVEEVLVDGPAKRKEGMYSGRSDTYKLINFPAENAKAGDLVNVRIIDAGTFSLTGELSDV